MESTNKNHATDDEAKKERALTNGMKTVGGIAPMPGSETLYLFYSSFKG